MQKTEIKTVDEYIAGFPTDIQIILKKVKETIQKAAPEAIEVISYGMPAYKLNGILVYFAAYKNHIGFYPTASGIETFQSELTPFKWAKGSVQFPLDRPIPFRLIDKMVRYRVRENLQKLILKKK
jgi:uncharacterized protein YdhG (YjbR/CyaY superfamily)